MAAAAGYRPLAGREYDRFALLQHHGLAAALCARPVLDQQKFAAAEVDTAAVQQAGELEGKGYFAIQVLMQQL